MKLHVAIAVVLAAGCGKKTEDAPAKTADPTAPVAAPAKAPAGGPTKWMAFDKLHIEAEVPSCAEDMSGDPDNPALIATGCADMDVGFHELGTPKETIDERLKMLADLKPAPEITRKDKLPDGWIIEYKVTKSGDSSPTWGVYAQVGSVSCLGESLKEATATAQRHACGSMRKK